MDPIFVLWCTYDLDRNLQCALKLNGSVYTVFFNFQLSYCSIFVHMYFQIFNSHIVRPNIHLLWKNNNPNVLHPVPAATRGVLSSLFSRFNQVNVLME